MSKDPIGYQHDCAICGRAVRVRTPKAGDGSYQVPYKHKAPNGYSCNGHLHEAVPIGKGFEPEDVIKYEEELRKRKQQERDLTGKAMKNQDHRPQKGWWAPGEYFCTCTVCGTLFVGDKRAGVCAVCAYAEPDGSDLTHLTLKEALAYARKTRGLIDTAMAQEIERDAISTLEVDPAYACSECGAQCEDLLSPVCFDCRQKMMLVPIEEHKRLQARITKLRWALGRSAHQTRVLKKESVQLDQVIDLATAYIADVSGTCPMDLFDDLDWDDCEKVCANGSISQDEVMTGCWRRYFMDKAGGK